MFKFFEKFAYLVVGILVTSYGYHYVDKHYPKVDLPYKDQIFRLENVVIYKVNKMITHQEEQMEEEK